MIEQFLNKVRRRETPLFDLLYRCLDAVRHFNMPVFKPLYNLLYYERDFRRTAFRLIMSKFYYEPMFKARCYKVGKRLNLENSGQGIPALSGPLVLNIGNNVRIVDRTTFAGMKLVDNPTLEIGNGSSISHGVSILVAKRVTIGRNCLIGSKLITDNIGHPVKFKKNRVMDNFSEKDVDPVIVEDDVFLGLDSVVMKGVRIGKGAVIGVGAVVRESVPPFSIVVGNPGKVVKTYDALDACGKSFTDIDIKKG